MRDLIPRSAATVGLSGDVADVRRRLPAHDGVDIGRSSSAGLRLQPSWVPRRLARFEPVADGWNVLNRSTSRMTVANQWVDAVVARGGLVHLQAASTTTLSWRDLDGRLSAEVLVAPPQDRRVAHVPFAIDRADVDLPLDSMRTDYAGERIAIRKDVLHALAVTFRHVIEESAPPPNVYVQAGSLLGREPAAVKRMVERVRDRVNAARPRRPIVTSEELGYYLVHVAAVLGPDLLEP